MSLLRSLKRLLVDLRDYQFYEWQGPRPAVPPALPNGFKLDHFQSHKDMPLGLAIGTGLVPGPLGLPRTLMAIRLRQKQASVVVLHLRGKVAAYGWLQTWQPFRTKFKAVSKDATMLGPYYTEPEHRGKGFYGLLLQESLRLAPLDKPAIIFTDPSNAASIKGIEKAGFTPIGTYRIKGFMRAFWSAIKISA